MSKFMTQHLSHLHSRSSLSVELLEMTTSICTSELVALTKAILESEKMSISASEALKQIGKMLLPIDDVQDYKFRIMTSIPCELILQTVKGTLLTSLWSTFARVDDEYTLLLAQGDNVDMQKLWSVEGVDALNSKINRGEIDWHLHRELQAILGVNQVGVLAFTKLLGRLLLSYPLFRKNKKYVTAMPASFMFNYLVVVSSCPLEVRIREVETLVEDVPQQGIPQKVCYIILIEYVIYCGKDILSKLMLPDGRGVWIRNYFPTRLSDGTWALCSGGQVTGSTSTIMTTTTSSVAASPALFNSYHETAVRVVELIEINLEGTLLAVVELVHHRNWMLMKRFVVQDVHLLCSVVKQQQSSGFELRTEVQIPMMDEQGWNNKCASLNKQLSAIDFANSAQWGLPIKDIAYYRTVKSKLTPTVHSVDSVLKMTSTTISSMDQSSATVATASKPRQDDKRLPSFDSVFKK